MRAWTQAPERGHSGEARLDTQTQQLGRYELLRCIARGGMGEIYLANARGAGGFQKKVVIKRILPYLADEAEFVQKFIDEANIVTHLTHGNIVPVFDMGEEDGELYIAMDYIPGRDLRDVLQRCRDEGRFLPVPVALYIAAEVCKGLAYAHRKTDEQGQPLHIIHRDVSPSNILLSEEGGVKLVDFGIAKATSRISKSVTGRLQGKFRYMSPEQAMGRDVDARSDIFSVGVVLYEMLTNERPFESERDLESLELVRTYNPPSPSTLRVEVPPEVDAIVQKAMAKEVGRRYAQVDELEKAILQWLYAQHGGLTSGEVAASLLGLFPEGLERPEVRNQSLVSAPRLTLDDAMAAELDRLLVGVDSRTPSRPSGRALARSSGGMRAVDPLQETATSASALPALTPETPDGTVSLVVERAALVSGGQERLRIGAAALDAATQESVARSVTLPVPALVARREELTPSPPQTELTPPGGVVVTAPPSRARWVAASVAALVLLAALWVARATLWSPPELVITVSPEDAQIFVNGAPYEGERPARLKNLKPGSCVVEARKEGFQVASREVRLERGEVSALRLTLEPAAAPARAVWFRSQPPGAKIFLNGEDTRETTPAQIEVPAAGAQVVLVDPSNDQRREAFTLLEGEPWGPFERRFSPPEVAPAEVKPAEVKPAEVKPAEVKPAEVAAEDAPKGSPEAEARPHAVTLRSTPAGAAVQINGAPRGKTPLTLSLAEGSYQVRLTLDGHQPYTATLRPQRSHHLDAQLSPAPAKEAPPTEPDPASLVEVSFYVTRDGAPGSSPCVLSVDGKEHRPGVGRYTLKLSAGPHRVTARGLDELSSYSASQSFQIAPTDKDKRIILTMRRADP